MAFYEPGYASSSDDDDREYDDDPDVTLDDIDKSKTINFSIRANYTDWEPREAFRELVQNWRDGIIKSFHLAEKDFSSGVVREERTSGRSTEIVYKVFRTTPDDVKEWLGYIRFKGLDGDGTIEITNRRATLQPWHLDLAGSSKVGDAAQAGAHGEGLKLALLVLMRGPQNHAVRCRSGAFNWRFNFTTRGRLVARLRRMTPPSIVRAEDQAQRLSERTLLPFAVRPAHDVQFVIGEPHKGRCEWGSPIRRRAVTRASFDDWTKAALFLRDAKDGTVVMTAHGDLLTDPSLRGKIYLKGLLLGESTPDRPASLTNLPLQFGYNFAFGVTNREREFLSTASEEAAAILKIWSGALTAKPEVVKELSDMLNAESQCADVSGARHRLSAEMASTLKNYLFGDEFKSKWYYTDEERSQNPRLDHIIQGLGCEGAQLTKLYWGILHDHGLIRTGEEEEHRRFTAVPAVTAPETSFARKMCRLLRACVRACPQTNGMAIRFVQAGQLNLQLRFYAAEKELRVHERWLSRDGAVWELGLAEHLHDSDVMFHAAKRLFTAALEQLPLDLFEEDDNSRTARWRRQLEISRAEQRLLDHLRLGNPTVTSAAQGPGLSVHWNVDPSWDEMAAIQIQCHRASTCSHVRDTLLVAEDGACPTAGLEQQASENGSAAGCRITQANLGARVYNQDGLEMGEEYFFVLALLGDPMSIVGLTGITRTNRAPAPAPRLAYNSAGEHREARAPAAEASASSTRAPGRLRNTFAPLNDTINGGRMSSSPEPEPPAAAASPRRAQAPPPPARPPPVSAHAAPASNGAPPSARSSATVTSFSLGPRLQSLDIFAIDKDRWYEAKSSTNVRAVIGILKGEEDLPDGTRKRMRVE